MALQIQVHNTEFVCAPKVFSTFQTELRMDLWAFGA